MRRAKQGESRLKHPRANSIALLLPMSWPNSRAFSRCSDLPKIMGFHRDTFYEVRRAFQTGGVAALVESKRATRGPHPNRVPSEVEAKVLDYCLKRPTHGAQRVSNELRLQDVDVSPSGVRGVWLRNDLETRYKRLMRLEQESRDNTTFILTEEQVRLLERHSPW